MKKLISLLFLWLPMHQWGQTYDLLPDSCTFCMHLTSWGTSTLFDTWYGIYPEEDTVINGSTYIRFYENQGVIGVRQQQNQLLGYHDQLDEDVLIMDFDHQLGDTIHKLYDYGILYSARIESIDSFQLNDGSYHRWLSLTGIRYTGLDMDTNNYVYSDWPIVWNERGLCHWLGGGLVYNASEQSQVMSILYAYPTWCTTDPRYNVPNNNTCDNCENPTRGDAGTLQLTNHRFSIHPNPAIDRVKIVFPSSEWRKVELMDALGCVRERQECAESICELNGTANLSPGLYYLRVYTAYGLMGIEQLVVQ